MNMYAEFLRMECEYMNFMSIANILGFMAGGAIPADKDMNSAEIWGVTLAGFGIVFAALVILVFVIFLFGKIFDTINQNKKNKEAAKAAAQTPKAAPAAAKPAPAPAAAPAPVAVSDEEDEIVAAIMAAVAMMSAADGKSYKIRSIKPAGTARLDGRAAWAMDGRRQNVMPF